MKNGTLDTVGGCFAIIGLIGTLAFSSMLLLPRELKMLVRKIINQRQNRNWRHEHFSKVRQSH